MDATPDRPFDPALDSTAFRNALGQFATGVTLITTRTVEGAVGIVANSFASVSLDPPLVLWSPAKSSRRFDDFIVAQEYAIHVLGSHQAQIAQDCARSKTAVSDIVAPTGVPIIPDALATFECRQTATHDAGDHVIIVGEVKRAWQGTGQPLVFYGGSYGGFAKT